MSVTHTLAPFVVLNLLFVIVCSQNGFSLNGRAASDYSGEAVGIGGDVNGDGIGDIIIGSSDAGSGKGQCYVIFGKSSAQPFPSQFNLTSLTGTNGFTINGLAAGDSLGISVFIGGDVNGDSLADIIIGAPNADGGGTSNSGQCYVIFGKTTGFSSPFNLNSLDGVNGLIINGNRASGYLGVLASVGGDVNGDGIGDIALGSPDTNVNGRAHIIFGKTTAFTSPFSVGSLNGANGFTVNGLATGDESGKSISIDGDINGDGINDIVIGALNADPNGFTSSGQAYIIFGKTSFTSTFNLNNLDGTNGFIINGITTNGRAGKVVSLGGDVNGDKFGDILIGSAVGNGYIIFGKNTTYTSPFNLNTLTGSNGFTITGITSNGQFGRPFSLGGDINDDGFDDILVGSHTTTSSRGQGYVIFGQSTFTSPIALTTLNGVNGFSIITGKSTNDQLGYSVSLGGDVNGDGTKDIMLSANQADPNSVTDAGQSFVIFGRNIKKTLFPTQINLSTMNNILQNQITLIDYTFRTDQIVSIQINSADFGSTLSSPYVFSATLTSSNPLPSGLTFNPTTLKFDGQTTEIGTFQISVFQSNFYGTVEGRFTLTMILPSPSPTSSRSYSPTSSRSYSPTSSRSYSPSTTCSMTRSSSITPSKSPSKNPSVTPSRSLTPSTSLSASPSLSPSPSSSQLIKLNITIESRTITIETEQYFMFHIEQQQFISYIGQPDNYSASISSNPLPSWLNFSPNDLSFEGRSNQTETFLITIIASNFNGSVTSLFRLNVVAIQREFIIYLNQTEPFEFVVSDPSGGEWLFSAQQKSGAPLPAFITFNSSTLSLSTIPSIQIAPQIVFVDVVGREDGEEKVKYNYSLVFASQSENSSNGDDVNIGAIVGGTVGGVFLLAVVVVIVVVIILIVKKKISASQHHPTKDAISF